ncbi:MAG: type II toxin-antitoxin system RelE/ParE family toxin [Candidatus Aminicenantes bacterium]|nr:MAG: type II toxin-antitoxin system RelE/ParE family toxin [Candidatus Aminicenantes bacterium]
MYKIFLLPQTQKDLDNFRGKAFQQIKNRIYSLKEDPRPPGCLKLTAEEGYRLRSGNYRIIYRINDKERKVYIYRIKHRKEAY